MGNKHFIYSSKMPSFTLSFAPLIENELWPVLYFTAPSHFRCYLSEPQKQDKPSVHKKSISLETKNAVEYRSGL